jgi:putative aldouronate transport system permease protein
MFQNPLNIATSEVFETYIYKVGLKNTEFSYSTAVGLFKSVVNAVFVIIANRGARALGQATFY